VTPEERALRDAYLAELWPTCREVPRDMRAGWAALERDRAERLAEACGEQELPFRGAA
jgi:hypothetical protein